MRHSLTNARAFTSTRISQECGRIADLTSTTSRSATHDFSHTCRYVSQHSRNLSLWRRGYSQSACRLDSFEQAIAKEDEAESEYSLLLKPKATPRPRSTQIRRSLRQWSMQNEQSKVQETTTTLPFEGRISRLPSALFLKDQENDEQEEYNESRLHSESNFTTGGKLIPGTLMSHQSVLTPRQNVIYLGDIGEQSLLLHSNGIWTAETISQKRYAISYQRQVPVVDFLSGKEVELLRAHLPKEDVTRALREGAVPAPIDVSGTLPENVTAPILSRMRQFREAEQQFLRNHRLQLDQMYDQLALQDKWHKIMVKDMPSLVIGMHYNEMTDAERKAFVHHANTHHPLIIAAQTAATITYSIGPKSLNETFNLVQTWARLYQEAAAQAALGKNVSEILRENPLSLFIDKARRIITESRKLRTPTSIGILGPVNKPNQSGGPQKVASSEKFTSNDKRIISYLWDTAMRRPLSRMSLAHASLIVRAIGAYPNAELGGSTFRMLLQELGCVNPWAATEDITAPLLGTKASSELDTLYREANASIATLSTGGSTESTRLPDSMAHLRRDWGDMEALCIDGTQTRNFEDAISVEPAGEIEDGFWIHLHFSHPTAHISLDHPVAKLARKLGAAFYDTISQSHHTTMVPYNFIQMFSLQANAPVLTISTLLANDGQVHDIKVTPGIIRNVHKLDVDAVTECMGIESDPKSLLIVGKVPKIPDVSQVNQSSTTAIPESSREAVSRFQPKLSLLHKLLTARRRCRGEEMGEGEKFRLMRMPVLCRARLPEGYKIDREFESYHWDNDPGIIVQATQKVQVQLLKDTRKDDISTQAMQLAAESMGKWLADRGIPAAFLGSEMPVKHAIQNSKGVGTGDKFTQAFFVRAEFPEPLRHHDLRQYAACTSPLRIFLDMTTHFQVDSYLKAQAKGFVQPDAPVQDESILAFSKAEMKAHLETDVAAADALEGLNKEAQKHWLFQALFRAFHFREAALPALMEVLLTAPARRSANGTYQPARGLLVPWKADVELEVTAEGYENKASIGDFLPATLVRVDPVRQTVTARAVGHATSEQTLLEPILAYSDNNLLETSPAKHQSSSRGANDGATQAEFSP